jgi:hypothetical protein
MPEENHARIARRQPFRQCAILLAFLCISISGCIPVKVAMQVKPVTGANLESEPDTSVIRVGVTTHAEVSQKFSAFDTGWIGDRLFLGRWLRSTVGVIPSPHTDRSWSAHNLVVEFDEKSVVTKFQVLSDKQFIDALPGFIAAGGAQSGFQKPSSGTSFTSENVMGKEFLNLAASDYVLHDESWTSRITREQIERFSAVDPGIEWSLTQFTLKIHLREKAKQEFLVPGGRRGKRRTNVLWLHADVPTIVLLVQFLRAPTTKH